MSTPGFQINIHNSLTSPVLLGGVPRSLAILNGTVAAAITFGLHSWVGIPLCGAIHTIALVLTKKDPYFFQVILRHLRKKSYYRV